VYTAKPLDYPKYLGYGGLSLTVSEDKKYRLEPLATKDALQSVIYDSWLH